MQKMPDTDYWLLIMQTVNVPVVDCATKEQLPYICNPAKNQRHHLCSWNVLSTMLRSEKREGELTELLFIATFFVDHWSRLHFDDELRIVFKQCPY